MLSNSSNPNDPQVIGTKQMIDEDLDELQSIMQRYHRKNSKKSLKKPKKRDGGLSNKNANIKRIGVDAITDVDPVL